MNRNLCLIAVYLFCLDQAKADYYEDYAKEYQKKYPYISPNPAENSSLPADQNCPDYNHGYPGCVIFDNHGKPVVFEGQPVSREVAEEYARNYNKKQR